MLCNSSSQVLDYKSLQRYSKLWLRILLAKINSSQLLAFMNLQPFSKLWAKTLSFKHSKPQVLALRNLQPSSKPSILNEQRTGPLVLQSNKLILIKLNATLLNSPSNMQQFKLNHALAQLASQVLTLKLLSGHQQQLASQVLTLKLLSGLQQQLASQVLPLKLPAGRQQHKLPHGHQQQLVSQVL